MPIGVPSANIDIESVTVQPRETLTVWLKRDYESGECVQLEIRVTNGGEIQLFCDGWDRTSQMPFKDWYPIGSA